jgi:hypothetical protein
MLELIHGPTDLFWASALIPPGLYREPNEDWIQLLEKVALIQKRTGVFIAVPRRDITGEEWEWVLRSAQALEHGYVERTTSSIRFGISKNKAKLLLSLRDNDKLPGITMTDHETANIFGAPVPLGRVLHVLEGFELTRPRAAEISVAISDAGSGDSVDVGLEAASAGRVRTFFLDWLTEEQRKEVPPRFLEEPDQ